MRFLLLFTTAICIAGFTACRGGRDAVFEQLPASKTGITFANTITTSDTLNELNDPYVYNGAGVGIGDIDNDGLPDIFFAGNMVSSRLYLNKGHMRFEDITASAGVSTNRWATGVTMVDINNDGYLDIYVSVSGPQWSKGKDRANLLFINNGNRTFTEEAERYGIADTGFTTHAAFLDYNRDGCLDLFLLENSPKDYSRGVNTQPMGVRNTTPGSYNQLYRNNCNGTFTNVSAEAGILRDAGYGLGVAIADVNGDGWPDIYVSNDGLPNDVLYINNRDGTFTNKAARSLKHTSQAGMGVDVADFNNDGWPDILQVDMLPHDLAREKRMSGFMNYANLLDTRARGFRDDYTTNVLQLSNGVTSDGDVVFSDIALMAGVARTDWSWSALFADFDNDGNKDIFISSGYPKAVNDLDYVTAVGSAIRKGDSVRARTLLAQLPPYKVTSYLFHNNADLTFTDRSKAWGIEEPSFSYGAAYADLDNDGRLDLVVNNIDGPAFVYHNVAPNDQHHALTVTLDGEPPNRRGIGATVIATTGAHKQYLYASPYRGFMSSMDQRLHFGLGAARVVDTLDVLWPDGRRQTLTHVPADTLLVVRQRNAAPGDRGQGTGDRARLTGDGGPVVFSPSPTPFPLSPVPWRGDDYSVQPLLPYMPSPHGPAIAVADVNGDGLDDIYVGGGGGVPGKLFLQQKDGRFVESSAGQPWEADKGFDDWDAVFFDANGDGRPDLYVASGGYQLSAESPLLQDRLYINQGGGRFVRSTNALPPMLTSKSVVRVADFNGDGKPDLFVGGRLTPRDWPAPTRSYILRNDGDHFTDVTAQVAPELVSPGGMITDAAWVDYDGDGRVDLVTVGEWMPIRFYHNDGKRFTEATAGTHLPPTRGWWYSLAVGDFDRDGRPDIIAGNVGTNFSYSTSKDSALGVYAGNFGSRQSRDVIMTQKLNGTEYPLDGMSPLGSIIYTLALRFPTYASLASASVQQMFTAAELQQSLHYEADTFASLYLHNDGGGRFTATPLPNLAQISPIRAMVAADVDGDGNLDLLLAGNLYNINPNRTRADAGNGLWLRGDGKGHLTPIPPRESGLLTPHDVAAMAILRTPAGRSLLVANTGDSLQLFAIRKR